MWCRFDTFFQRYRNVLVPNCLFQRVPNCLFQRMPNCLDAELFCFHTTWYNLVEIRLPKKFSVCVSIQKFLRKPNLNEITLGTNKGLKGRNIHTFLPFFWPFLHLYIIHMIELLCYNWRFVNFWLEIWSHNWRFFIDVFDVCFHCLLMFSFCLFQYWTNCIPFQYILFTFLSY